MPIYEYECINKKCDCVIETLQKISEAPLTKCPKCNKETLHKRITSAGFRLTGSGWYKNTSHFD